MAVRPRNGRWMVDLFYRGERYTKTWDSEDEAKLDEATNKVRLINEHKNGKAVKKIAWTLEYACTETMRLYWKGQRSETTNQKCIDCLQAYLGKDTLLDTLTVTSIDNLKAELKAKGNCPSTINRRLAVLSKILHCAVDRDGLAYDKKPKVELCTEGEGRIRVVSYEEEQLMTRWLSKHASQVFRRYVENLLDSGARPSEMLNIDKTDCDFTDERGVLRFKDTKTDVTRYVPMTKRLRANLKQDLQDGRLYPYSYAWARKAWLELAEGVGLGKDDSFDLYACRHTYATRLIKAGRDVSRVKLLMGHKKIQTTLRYVHLDTADLVEDIEALEAAAPAKLRMVK